MEKIYKTLYRQLFNAVSKITNEEALAKDIVQSAFLKALQTKHPLKEEKAAFAWVLKIAKNELIDYRRKQLIHTKYTQRMFAEHALESPYSTNKKSLQKVTEHLFQKLTELSPRYKAAVSKATIENIPQTILATDEHISVSAIKSRVQRGRKELEKVFKKECSVDIDSYGNILDCVSRIPDCSCG